MMLTSDGVDDATLFDGNTIIDLSRVGSTETKSLFMGLIVLKLQEHRMAAADGMNQPLRHLTVLEEAHNLLKRTSMEQSTEGGNLLGKSVEMLSNSIAEMRTYGEGFIIADQAPGLLDMAAIRNTNTKIIHRLPDLSDRELVGRAANLNAPQIVELARLPKGVAAVYQNDWVEPVMCKVSKADDAEPLVYTHSETKEKSANANDAFDVAEVLAKGDRITDKDLLRDLREALDRIDLDSSMKVRILRTIQNPPEEPRMLSLAPIMGALFPNVREATKDEIKRCTDVRQWTVAADSALRASVSHRIDDIVRTVVIQGIMTDILHVQEQNDKAFSDWHENGRLIR